MLLLQIFGRGAVSIQAVGAAAVTLVGIDLQEDPAGCAIDRTASSVTCQGSPGAVSNRLDNQDNESAAALQFGRPGA